MRSRLLGVLAILLCPCLANATLIDRGNDLFYDDVLDITWFQPIGGGTWQAAADNVGNLTYAGFDDWRLPSMSSSSSAESADIVRCFSATEQDCRDNELGYMFHHNLGGTFSDGVEDSPFVFFVGPFIAWSSTQWASDPTHYWAFVFNGTDPVIQPFFPGTNIPVHGGIALASAWAVRDGDVITHSVPEPATLTLMMLGLGAIGCARRRRVRGDVTERDGS